MAEIMHHDPRKKQLSSMKDLMPEVVQAEKRINSEAVYRPACMEGATHPLEIEKYDYQLVEVKELTVSFAQFQRSSERYRNYIDHLIECVMSEPDIEWAVDNSFDGLYMMRSDFPSEMAFVFKFGVYLRAELATFWNLKYLGRT